VVAFQVLQKALQNSLRKCYIQSIQRHEGENVSTNIQDWYNFVLEDQ
jgi:hypothetical protein